MFRRSRELEALNRLDEAREERKSSVQLYIQLSGRSERGKDDLTDEDFDALIAFWSR